MDIRVDTKDLIYALNIVKDTVGNDSKGHEGIRIYASKKNNRVKLSSYDGHFGTEVWIDASVKDAGKTVIKADRFVKYAMKLNGTARMRVNKAGSVAMETTVGKTTFIAFDPASFPEMPTVDEDNKLNMPGQMYRSLINGVAFCTKTEKEGTNQPVLEGVHFVTNGKRLELFASNGQTIAYYRKKVSTGKMNMILPKKSLVNSARMVRDDDKVTIRSGNNAVCSVKFRDVTYYMPVIEGVYPDLKKALPPKDFETEFVAEKKQFLELLDRGVTALASKGSTKGIIQFETNSVMFRGNTAEVDFSEKLPSTLIGSADDIRIDLNRLMTIVKNIESDVIRIGVRDQMPLTLRPDGRSDHTCLLAVG